MVCKTAVYYELFCCYLIVFHGVNLQKRSSLWYIICPETVGVEFGFKLCKCLCPMIVTPHKSNTFQNSTETLIAMIANSIVQSSTWTFFHNVILFIDTPKNA